MFRANLNSLRKRIDGLRREELAFACPGGIQAIIDEGSPLPAGPRCRICGGHHILEIREEIAEMPEQRRIPAAT